MENGDIHALAADFLDDKTIGGFDVFKVDRTKRRFQRADDVGQFLGVALVQLDIKTVDVCEFLEQDRLALHHRLGCQPADVAKAQNGGAIGDNADQITARGIVAGGVGVGLDLETCLGHAGRIGAR